MRGLMIEAGALPKIGVIAKGILLHLTHPAAAEGSSRIKYEVHRICSANTAQAIWHAPGGEFTYTNCSNGTLLMLLVRLQRLAAIQGKV